MTTTTPTITTGLISADDHMDMCYVPRNLWQSRVAEKWRADAPKVVTIDSGRRLWVREGRVWGTYGSKKVDGRKVPFDLVGLTEEVEPDTWRASTPKYRLEDMDRDGVYAQVIFNFVDWTFEDQDLKAECMSAFNDWIAEFCFADPNRLVGLGVLPSHDPGAAVKELEHIIDLGLRGAMFDVFGATRSITDPAWDHLWSAAEETSSVITVHIGTGGPLPPRAQTLEPPPRLIGWRRPVAAALMCMSLANVLAEVTMSGLLERHPNLKFMLGESSLGWIPFVLERLDFECKNYKDISEGLPTLKPSEQFRRNMYCTFQDERIGVDLIPELGEDNVMWASDYPHGDGTYPFSSNAVEQIFARSTPEIRRKATHDTAQQLFRIT